MSRDSSTAASAASLKQAWQALRTAEPELYARNIAHRLATSEGELVACRTGEGVTRLHADDWGAIFRDLRAVGRVMVLTRNDSCVHEKKGWFEGVNLGKTMGAVVGGAIDLRVFLSHFAHGFAVSEVRLGQPRESLQFFDADGTAVHKVYRLEQTDVPAWRALVARYTAADQAAGIPVRPVVDPLPLTLADEAVDVSALREGWRNMGYGPHEFYGLLKRLRTTRLQALRLVGSEFARLVSNDSAERVLHEVSRIGLPIMVFTGSPGLVQIHSGPVRNIRPTGPWINVLDEDFSLHLRQDQVAQSWVVKKPTADGPVTSLELYAADGGQIVQFFGQRLPGRPEIAAWTRLADNLAGRPEPLLAA